MARTRAQRRRHSLFITIALVATLVALIFARDISRSGHGAITAQRSENLSFASLANALIVQENNFDGRFYRLLQSGSTLSRADFDARLDQLDEQLAYWTTTADLLRRPKLDKDINDVIADQTETRVDDYEAIFALIAQSLRLPAPSPGPSGTTSTNPANSLYASALKWNRERTTLRKDPGHVRLDALTLGGAKYFEVRGVSTLTSSSSLAVVRGIGIAAVSVEPSPLPARHGDLLLPPVSKIRLGISVVNTGFIEQHLTLDVSMVPQNGPLAAQRQTFHVVLAPLQSYAFLPEEIAVVPSERGTLTIAISGAPAATDMARSERFAVEMSPVGAPPTTSG